MRVPWILRLPFRFLRAAGLFLLHGPHYFCWRSGCPRPAWSGCHATAADNGPMCREHCEEASYHSAWRTGCEGKHCSDSAEAEHRETLRRLQGLREEFQRLQDEVLDDLGLIVRRETKN
jgi:hypothetical protein